MKEKDMNSRDNIQARYDALIVGARVAGAATAMLLARAGLRVLTLDRSAHGSDTLSTLALMRGGVMQLHRWGVLDRIVAAGTPPIRRTSFHYGAAEALREGRTPAAVIYGYWRGLDLVGRKPSPDVNSGTTH